MTAFMLWLLTVPKRDFATKKVGGNEDERRLACVGGVGAAPLNGTHCRMILLRPSRYERESQTGHDLLSFGKTFFGAWSR